MGKLSFPKPFPSSLNQILQIKLNNKNQTVGVLSMEIAAIMLRTTSLYCSLSSPFHISDAISLPGVRILISSDETQLLTLAAAELSGSLSSLSLSVSRLSSRCTDPMLRHVDQLFIPTVNSTGWEFKSKNMEKKVQKMEKLVGATGELFREIEVLAELEQSLCRSAAAATAASVGPTDSARRLADLVEAKRKVAWQRQLVDSLRETSLWNKSFDYVVKLLARSILTIAARFMDVFKLDCGRSEVSEIALLPNTAKLTRSQSTVGSSAGFSRLYRFRSGNLLHFSTRSEKIVNRVRDCGNDRQSLNHGVLLPPRSRSHRLPTPKWMVSGPFKGCMAGGNDSVVLQSGIAVDGVDRRRSGFVSKMNLHCRNLSAPEVVASIMSVSLFDWKCKSTNAPPLSLGAAGLALHYANIIIVIEKLVASPHLIGLDARDDLYSMLTTSIRVALKTRLKRYAKSMTSSVRDAGLAAEWREAVARILEWLAPLAHNMIRWQSERNFEQQQLASTNILLVQTLYFANQTKSEAAMIELFVGLNYLWRFGREFNE